MIEAPWVLLLQIALVCFQFGLLVGARAPAFWTEVMSSVVTVVIVGIAAVVLLSWVLLRVLP